MKERPIIFNGAMVRALLAWTKTQTRRLVKPQPEHVDGATWVYRDGEHHPCRDELSRGILDLIGPAVRCPYGVPGDQLWVRERLVRNETDDCWHYVADDALIQLDRGSPHVPAMVSWAHHKESDSCPSIHMPRWASRITLEVTDVRVECLQGIRDDEARAEGLFVTRTEPTVRYAGQAHNPGEWESPVLAYADLWDSINGKRAPWSSNPWVWVVGFRRVTP